MPYTFEPEQPHAKAFGRNMRVSTKKAQIMCKVITKKKLSVVKRLLEDLAAERRSLQGSYYTKAVTNMLELIASAEANAKALGLDAGKLFVHVSATHGTVMRRGRRKASFGSRLKSTNIEVILIERGSGKSKSVEGVRIAGEHKVAPVRSEAKK